MKAIGRVLHILILVLVFASCSAEREPQPKEISIIVLDQNTNLPVDSAKVTLITIVEARDVYTQENYTDASGRCTFTLAHGLVAQYQVVSSKPGLLSYFDAESADFIRSTAFVNAQTGNNLVLYLTSDTLNHIRYWADHTIRYETDSLIRILRSNRYPERLSLPALLWKDIPGLLTIANDSTRISHFPVNPLSSFYMNECYVGIVSLWFVESIRITDLNDIYDPQQKFPSLNPALRRMDDQVIIINDSKAMAMAYHAYLAWWEKAKNMDPEQAKKLNPLENTGLAW